MTHPVPLDPNIQDKEDPLYIDEPYTRGQEAKKEETSSFLKELMEYIDNQVDKIFLNDDMSLNFKNVTDKVIHHFFSDLEAYYGENCVPAIDQDCSARASIQDRLIRKLEQYRGYRIMLIAHSMGSIVAYDVLTELGGKFPVHTFITIGSPLGFPVIVGRIPAGLGYGNHPGSPKQRVPENITNSWINISDIRDKIALDHTLGDDFGANSRGLRVKDIYVRNDYEVDGDPNPHKSFGYLRAPEMAEIINGFIEGGRSRFYRGYHFLAERLASGLQAFSDAVGLGRK